MSELSVYIENRKKRDPAFAHDYENGYEEFKVGFMLKELRKREGMTQEELAARLNTKKSVISRMENHTEDIRLSTIGKVAGVFGKKVRITIE